MARVRIRQRPDLRVDDAVEEADEASLGDVAAEDAIDLLAELRRLGASVANARTAACRFDISSAAGMPLPTTSAIDSAEPVRPEPDRVEAVAADAGRRLPRRRELEPVDLRQNGRQQLALDAARFVELARDPAPAATSLASRLDLDRSVARARRCPTASARSPARRGAWLRPRDRPSPSRS